MTNTFIQDFLNRGFILEAPTSEVIIGSLGADESVESPNNKLVVTDFEGERKAFSLSNFEVFSSREELLQKLPQFSGRPYLWSDKLDFDNFADRFRALDFSSNGLHKAVLYEVFRTDVSTGPEQILEILARNSKQGGAVYGAWSSSESFFGYSPEFLFYKNKEGYFSQAVAGTANVSESSLLEDSKIIKEHGLVKEYIESLSSVQWSKTEEKSFGALKHLFSEAKILNIDNLQDLHPTSAIGVMPKALTSNLNLGPLPRNYYGGCVELLIPGFHFSTVMIRGLFSFDDKTICPVGVGVVAESKLESEQEEIVKKWKALKKIWG